MPEQLKIRGGDLRKKRTPKKWFKIGRDLPWVLPWLQKYGNSSVSSLESWVLNCLTPDILNGIGLFSQLFPSLLHFSPQLTVRAQLGAKSEQLLKKGRSIPDILLVNILVNAIKYVLPFPFSYLFHIFFFPYVYRRMCSCVTYVFMCMCVRMCAQTVQRPKADIRNCLLFLSLSFGWESHSILELHKK